MKRLIESEQYTIISMLKSVRQSVLLSVWQALSRALNLYLKRLKYCVLLNNGCFYFKKYRWVVSDWALCWNVMLLYMLKCISPLIIWIVSSPTLFIWFQGRKKNIRIISWSRPVFVGPLILAKAVGWGRDIQNVKHLDHIYIQIHSIFAAVDFKPDHLDFSKHRKGRQGDLESVDYMKISKTFFFFVKHIKFYCRKPKYFQMLSFS